jgi:hypothetical protein
MSKLIKVKDAVGLHRDMGCGAILNTSSSDYDKYIVQRQKMLSEKTRISNLEKDVTEIKDMLQQLLSKL